MQAPKISVIVPIYNVERYLSRCLDSLCAQTLYDIEIICIDDGSTDSSPSILATYATRDPRIVVRSQSNAGQATARNRALDLARAPYIMFCDSDDWYSPTMCERMLATICSELEVDYAVCAAHIHYEHDAHMSRSDAKYYKIKHQGLVEVDDAVRLSTDVSVWNKIFRRDVIISQGIRFPEGVRYEDTAFYHLYALCSQKAVYLPERLYNYRRRAGSTMCNTFDGLSHNAADMLSVAKFIHSFMAVHGYFPVRKLYYGRLFFDLLTSALGFEQQDAGRQRLLEQADSFLAHTGLDFAGDAELSYRRALLARRILPGSVHKRLWGLIATKYKPHCAKHYFMGLPLLTNYRLPA